MTSQSITLGQFITDLMEIHKHTNRSLAAVAGISESAVRNLLKVGIEEAKEPDARTLRMIADALGVNPLILYRLAGYLPPDPGANSPRARYLADVFDSLPPSKKDAVMGVLQAMASSPEEKAFIQEMRESSSDWMIGMDLMPHVFRDIANRLIVEYNMTSPEHVDRVSLDTEIGYQTKLSDMDELGRKRIRALIRHKLMLEYDASMEEPE